MKLPIAALAMLAAVVVHAQTGTVAPGTGASTPSLHRSTGTGRFEINPPDRPLGEGLRPILPSYGSAFGRESLGELPGAAGPLAPPLAGSSASGGSSSAPVTTRLLPGVGIPGAAASGLPGTSPAQPPAR